MILDKLQNMSEHVKKDNNRSLFCNNINGHEKKENTEVIDMNNIFEKTNDKKLPNGTVHNQNDDYSESSDEDSNIFQNQELSPERIKDIIFGTIGLNCLDSYKANTSELVLENLFSERTKTKGDIVSHSEHNDEEAGKNGENSDRFMNGREYHTIGSKANFKVYNNVKKSSSNIVHTPSMTITEYLDNKNSDFATNIDIKHNYSNEDIDIGNGNIMSAQLQQFECFEKNTLKFCFNDSYKMGDEWENERNIIMEIHTEQNDFIEHSEKEKRERVKDSKHRNNFGPSKPMTASGYRPFFTTRPNEREGIAPKSDIQIRLNFNEIENDDIDNKNLESHDNVKSELFENDELDLHNTTESSLAKDEDSTETNDIFDYLRLDKRRPSEIQRDLENKIKNRKRRSLRVERLKQIQENAKELLRLKEGDCPDDLINESIPHINNKLCDDMPVLEPVAQDVKIKLLDDKFKKNKKIKNKQLINLDTAEPKQNITKKIKQDSAQIVSKRSSRSSTDSNKNKKIDTVNDIDARSKLNQNRIVPKQPRELINLKNDLNNCHVYCGTNENVLNNCRVTRNFRLLRSRFIMNNRYQRIANDKRSEIKKLRHKKVGRVNNKILENDGIIKELSNKNNISKFSRSVEFFDKFSSKVYCDILQQSSKLQYMIDDMMSDGSKGADKLSIVEISEQKPTKVNDFSGEVKLTTFMKDQKLQYLDSGLESDIDENGSYDINKISNHLVLKSDCKKMPRLKRMVYNYPTRKIDLYAPNASRYFDKSNKGTLQICAKDDNIFNVPKIKPISNIAHNSIANNFETNEKFYMKICSEPKSRDGLESLNDIGDDKEVKSIFVKNNIVIIVKEKSVNFYEHSTGVRFFRSPKLWLFKGSLSRYMPESEMRLDQVTNQLTTSSDMVTAYIELLIKPRNLNSSQLFTAVCDMSAVIYRYSSLINIPNKTVLHLDYPQCSMDCLVFTVLPSDRAIAVGYISSISNAPDFTIKKYLMPKDYTGNTDIITLPEVTFLCNNLQAVNADIILGYGAENVVLWHHGYETILQIINLSTLSESIVNRDLSSLFIKDSSSRCVWAKWDSSCGTGSMLHMIVHHPEQHILVLLTGSGVNWSAFKIMHIFDLPKKLQRLKSLTVGQFRVVAAFEEGGISYDFSLLPLQTEKSNCTEECTAINVQNFENCSLHASGDMIVFCKNGTAIPLTVEQL